MNRSHPYATHPASWAGRLCQWAGLIGLGLILPAGTAHGLAVTNGSFETGDTTGWVGYPDGDKLSVVSDTAAHEGSKVAKLDFASQNKLIQDIENPATVLVPGQSYNFTVWYRYATSNAQDGPALVWHYMDKDGALAGSYHSLGAGTGNQDTWVKAQNDIVAMDQPWLRLIFIAGAGMGANGTAWVDDVRIEEPAAGFSNPLINPSFEMGGYSGWTPWPAKEKVSVVSESAAPDGAKVAKIDFSGHNELDQDIYGPANKLIPGQKYTMTAWYRFTSDKAEDMPGLVWLYFESDGVTATGWHSVGGNAGNTATWTQIQNDIIGEDKPQFRVILSAGASVLGTGTAWFDNVQITESTGVLTNGLTNPSFETGDLTGWQAYPAGDKVSVISETGAPDGSKVAKVDFSDNNQLIQDVNQPADTIVPGQVYSLSAWYRFSSSKAEDSPSMNWYYFDSSNTNTGWNPVAGDAGNTSSWKMIATTMTGEDQPLLRIKLDAGASVGGTGTAWFDDVRLSTPGDISGPASVDFGSQDTAAGPTAPKAIEIQNPGPGELVLGSASLATGTEFSITEQPTLATVVPAGGKATISVAFDPNPPEGNATDTLRVVSNAPGKSPLNITLSGLKVPVELSTFSAE